MRCERCECTLFSCQCPTGPVDRLDGEDPYQYAHRRGAEAAGSGGDWRDNPHTPGTREWFEFDDGLGGRR